MHPKLPRLIAMDDSDPEGHNRTPSKHLNTHLLHSKPIVYHNQRRFSKDDRTHTHTLSLPLSSAQYMYTTPNTTFRSSNIQWGFAACGARAPQNWEEGPQCSAEVPESSRDGVPEGGPLSGDPKPGPSPPMVCGPKGTDERRNRDGWGEKTTYSPTTTRASALQLCTSPITHHDWCTICNTRSAQSADVRRGAKHLYGASIVNSKFKCAPDVQGKGLFCICCHLFPR